MRSEKEEAARKLRQRQAMITQAIELGVFDDRDHFKAWMKKEFNLSQPVSKISTEYTLSAKQMKLLFHWLRYFTNQGPKPRIHRANPRITSAQEREINTLSAELGFTPSSLADFIQRQTGKRKLVTALFKDEATKVITGLQQILKDNQPKS